MKWGNARNLLKSALLAGLASAALVHASPVHRKSIDMPAGSTCPEILEAQHLPSELLWVTDVRWAQNRSVFIAEMLRGVYQISLDDTTQTPRLMVRRGNGIDEIWLADSLAASPNLLAVGGMVFSFGWTTWSHEGLMDQFPMALVVDLDLSGNRVLLLGAQRDDAGRYAPDGAVAWIGTLAQGPDALTPVFYSSSGPGARNMDACGPMLTGAVRFLPDGSFVIVPGVEPDVYLYGPQGKLLRVWSSEAVGFDAGCGLSDEDMYRLSADEPGRWAWVNQRRTVDDVLALPEGPGLIVRSVRGGKTHWQLKILSTSGTISSCDLPISSDSDLAHLAGDVRDGELVLLVAVYGHTPQTRRPETPPRLVTFKYNR